MTAITFSRGAVRSAGLHGHVYAGRTMTTLPAGSLLPLVVRTVAVPDPGPLLSLLPAHRSLAWIHQGDGIVGWGEAARLELSGPARFSDAADWWARAVDGAVVRDEVDGPGTGPVVFASFSFDEAASSVLVIPQIVVGRRRAHWWVTTIDVGASITPPPTLSPATEPRPPRELTFTDGSLSGVEWERSVAEAVRRICAGELEKVVLARDLVARTDTPIDPRWPLGRLAQSYPTCWTYAVDGLLGATPEMLVRLERGLVTSRVLAGTIRRTGDDAKDLALAASLARSSKDLEEHEYAVRSVAGALSQHCSSMYTPEAPFVLHLANVMHLATDVAGVVHDGASVLELAESLHPTAAVCGTPTDAARAVIGDLEGMRRGRYAGPVGWIGPDGDGELGIALRCAEVTPDSQGSKVRLFAGCGIVAGSDPEAELAEAQAKFLAVRDALLPE